MKRQSSNCFTENDIRPRDLMDGQRIAFLLDVGRMLSRCGEFVPVSCPACESAETKGVFQKYGLDYVSCNRCGTLYINPRPSPEVLEWFYRESENYAYWNRHIFPVSEKSRREKIFVSRVDRVISLCGKYGVQGDSLLEVGAAYGTFCEEMKTRNYFKRIVAVEPTPDLANTCRKKGIETIETPVEKMVAKPEDLYDVIVSFEVIEHLFSPKDFILHCGRMLKPGGLFVVTCPNAEGFDISVLGPLCNNIDHEHLNYFNPSSLAILMESYGYDVLESQTPGRLDAELVRNKILSGEMDISQQPFLKKVLVENWETAGDAFQEFLAKNGLSSHLWMAVKKRKDNKV
jgi:2-polyprenyl-3-methyl-5-hydroxy-6-metoxy-1,4-benzoquinol methylase/ribosomal protein S27E